jgi:glutathione S-transferase
MLKIWGRRNSSNVISVMWTLGELGLDYERINQGGSFGGNDDPGYRALNPNGLVPTLEEDGKTIWESNSIVRYLASVYGENSLSPADPYRRAVADQWMDWTKTTFYPAFMPVFAGLIRTPPEKQDFGAIDLGVQASASVLRVPEAHLARQSWLGGDSFTMADIPLGAMIYRYFNLPIERPPLPALEDWYRRLTQRPAYRKHAMIPFGASLVDWVRLEAESAEIQ